MARGRTPSGPKLVDCIKGSESAKQRLKVILETLSGSMSIEEACEELGIGPAAFHKLRSRTMQEALESLAPRPMGRPAKDKTPEQARIEELEQEVAHLEMELEGSRLREEIALVMPHLLKKRKKGGGGSKKKRKRKKR
jgi:transposase-like protein